MKSFYKINNRKKTVYSYIVPLLFLFTQGIVFSGELKTLYNKNDYKVMFSGKHTEHISCRLSTTSNSLLKSIKVILSGTKTKKAIRIRVYGQEGGLPIPLYLSNPLKDVFVDKEKDGIEEVSFDIINGIVLTTNNFIVISEINPEISIVSDKQINTKNACVNDGLNYSTCQIKLKGHDWRLLPQNVNLSVFTENLPENIKFVVDTTILKKEDAYIGTLKNISVDDCNGDGYNDVLVNNTLFINKKGYTLVKIKDTNLLLNPKALKSIFIDLDNDGKKDILQLGVEKTISSILYRTNENEYTKKNFRHIEIDNISCLSVGYYNNDDLPDIFVGQRANKDSLGNIASSFIILGASETDNINSVAISPKLHGTTVANFVDIDYDGNTDLFMILDDSVYSSCVYKYDENEEKKFLLNESGNHKYINNNSWSYVDKDDMLDHFLSRRTMDRFSDHEALTNYTLMKSSVGVDPENYNNFISKSKSIGCSDINGDGFEDLIVGYDNDCSQMSIYLQSESYTFEDRTLSEGFPYITNVEEFILADIDNNGTSDFVVVSNDSLRVIRNLNTSNFRVNFSQTGKLRRYNSIVEYFVDGRKYKKQLISGKGNGNFEPFLSALSSTKGNIDSLRFLENGTETVNVYKDIQNAETLEIYKKKEAEIYTGEKSLSLSIYPNPTNKYLFLDIKNAGDNKAVTIQIKSSLGNIMNAIVKNSTDFPLQWECLSFNGTELPSGVYYALANIGNTSIMVPFQIIK